MAGGGAESGSRRAGNGCAGPAALECGVALKKYGPAGKTDRVGLFRYRVRPCSSPAGRHEKKAGPHLAVQSGLLLIMNNHPSSKNYLFFCMVGRQTVYARRRDVRRRLLFGCEFNHVALGRVVAEYAQAYLHQIVAGEGLAVGLEGGGGARHQVDFLHAVHLVGVEALQLHVE